MVLTPLAVQFHAMQETRTLTTKGSDLYLHQGGEIYHREHYHQNHHQQYPHLINSHSPTSISPPPLLPTLHMPKRSCSETVQWPQEAELLLHLSNQPLKTGTAAKGSFSIATSTNTTTNAGPVNTAASAAAATSSVARGFNRPNFGNDYSSAYVHSKVLPQNYVQNINNTQLGYPRLQKLHELKREHTLAFSAPPVSVRVPTARIPDYIDQLGNSCAQFDVMMVHGCLEPFPIEQLQQLKIEKISSKPSLIFLWCTNEHIGSARMLLEKWGFRNAEDIAYLVSSTTSAHMPKADGFSYPGNPSSGQSMFRHTAWHCLMGLKGTLRRSTDVDLIHCNVNTDVIIEKTAGGPKCTNVVPNEIYELVENFTSMGRRIHIVPTESSEQLPVRPRPGWVVVSPNVFSIGELVPERYRSRNIMPSLDEVEALRPRTPTKFRAKFAS